MIGLDFDVFCKAIVIGQIENPVTIEVGRILNHAGIEYESVFEKIKDEDTRMKNNFHGFMLTCLPQGAVARSWQHIDPAFQNYYNIYYYDCFYVLDLINNDSDWPNFDFLIVGEDRKKRLLSLIKFIKFNFWRKIPVSLFCPEKKNLSILGRKILSCFELADDKGIDAEDLSIKLRLDKKTIKRQVKSEFQLSFQDFRDRIIDYYIR